MIGCKVRVKPKREDNWVVTLNIWGAVAGVPSMKKTPAMYSVYKFINELEEDLHEDYKNKLKQYEGEEFIAKNKLKALEKKINQGKSNNDTLLEEYNKIKENNNPPTRKRLITSDPTTEKIGQILVENPNGIGVIRDELVGFFKSLDKSGREGDRAFYLQSWNGYGTFNVDRIGRGSINIKNLCLSLFGTIQPDRLSQYIYKARNGGDNDGLIQRLQLLVHPKTNKNRKPTKETDVTPNAKASDAIKQIIRDLYFKDPTELGGEIDNGIIVFKFDDEAQELYYQWLDELNVRIINSDEDSIFKQHLEKYSSLLPKLALIFHLVDISSKVKPEGDIPKEQLLRAISWCEYLETHAKKVYNISSNYLTDAARKIVKLIKNKELENGFTARDLYRRGLSGLDSKTVDSALELLEDYFYLTKEELIGSAGGRPKYIFKINPKVFNN